jgi:hypothetical protein
MLKVTNAIFFNRTGLPLTHFTFSDDKLQLDQMLLGGFLSAITGIANEIFAHSAKSFVVDNGKNKITIILDENIILALLAESSLMHLEPGLMRVMNYFASNFDLNSNQLYAPHQVDQVRIRLIGVLYPHPIQPSWMVHVNSTAMKLPEVTRVVPKIKEIRSGQRVQELSFYDPNNPNECFDILNYAAFERVVKFSNLFENFDYIIAEDELLGIMTLSNVHYSNFTSKFENFDLVTIARKLNNATLVKDLTTEFGSKILEALQFLYDLHLISKVDPKYKRLFFTIDMCNDLLRELYILAQNAKLSGQLGKFLQENGFPEMLRRLEINTDLQYQVKKDQFFFNMDTNELAENTATMQKMANLIMDYMNQNYQRNAKKILEQKIQKKYPSWLPMEDFDLLKPLTAHFQELTKK